VISAEEAVDLDQKPTIKKRVLIASLLALAAVGTHWLPGRTIVPMQSEPQQAVANATSEKIVTGPNSLIGDAIADPTAQVLASADLYQSHLDTDATVDQAGLGRMLAGLDAAPGVFAVPSGSLAGSVSATAVPEPRTAGILLLAAAPIVIRRKRRAGAAV
jgi:hypothetical protein